MKIKETHIRKSEDKNAADHIEGTHYASEPEFHATAEIPGNDSKQNTPDSSPIPFQFKRNTSDGHSKSDLDKELGENGIQIQKTPFKLKETNVEQSQTLQLKKDPKPAAKSPGLAEHISDYKTNVNSKTAEKDRLGKADAIINSARKKLGDIPAKVKKLKHNSQIPLKEKIRVLGLVMAGIAKIEFLLGKIYYKGQPTMERKFNTKKNKWQKTSNSGVLIDYYKSQLGLSKSSSYAWCTMFVGSVHKAIGATNARSKNFLSGYRMRGKTQISKAEGGKMVGLKSGFKSKASKNPWHLLKNKIAACKTDDQKKDVLDLFLKGQIQPQPGDSMVVKRGSANSNSFTSGKKVKGVDGKTKIKGAGLSHTTMVEKYEDYKIYTIEGNKGNNISGRVYDLKKPSDISKIIYMKRFGFSHIDAGKAGKHLDSKKSKTLDSLFHQTLASFDLVVPINILISQLLPLVDSKAKLSDTAYKLDGRKSGGSDN